MNYKTIILLITFSIIIILMFLKDKNDLNIKAININKNHICANDSMILLDYKGPKAQILWKDNTRSYYCEVREAFYETTDKIKQKNIKAFFVQNFSNTEWGSYIDKWMYAKDAYYIIDSNMDGAMGITYVPFDNIDNAKKFLKIYGGELIKYENINKKTLNNSSLLLKDRIIF